MDQKIELPDLTYLGNLIDEIGEISTKITFLDIDIKLREAEINKEASINPIYFQNNKPPSQSYIENTWKFGGFNNELIPLRKELAQLEVKLEGLKMKYKLYIETIGIWRTQTANERIISM